MGTLLAKLLARGKRPQDANSSQPCKLTEKEIIRLRRSWQMIERELERIGVLMFMGVFEEHPDIEKFFLDRFSDDSASKERFEEKLKVHGLRFMKLLGDIMENLSNWENVEELLDELGLKHGVYNVPEDMIAVFGMQFMFAIRPVLDEGWNKDVECAWEALFNYIAYKLKTGILQYRKSLIETSAMSTTDDTSVTGQTRNETQNLPVDGNRV